MLQKLLLREVIFLGSVSDKEQPEGGSVGSHYILPVQGLQRTRKADPSGQRHTGWGREAVGSGGLPSSTTLFLQFPGKKGKELRLLKLPSE